MRKELVVELFPLAYMKNDCNAARAAIELGYSPASASEQGYRLLQIPAVKQRIQELIDERAGPARIGAMRVIEETCDVAFSRVDHTEIDPDTERIRVREGAPSGAIAAVKSVKYRTHVRVERDGSIVKTIEHEIVLWDKVAALNLLAKHLGLLDGARQIQHTAASERVHTIQRVVIDVLPPAPIAAGAIPAQNERDDERYTSHD